jgi:hypothetical protein
MANACCSPPNQKDSHPDKTQMSQCYFSVEDFFASFFRPIAVVSYYAVDLI